METLRNINWILIGTLIVVSALVSWAGDVIGMKLGKKRITFLKIRPKYTSRIISVLTGIGIAVATIFALSIASEEVRTALFSMQVVERQLITAREDLRRSQDSMAQMSVDLFQSRGDLSEKEEQLRQVEEKLANGTKSLDETRAKLDEMTKMRDKAEAEQAELAKGNEKLLAESKKLENSIETLNKQAETLRTDVQRLREGRIAAFTGEMLAQDVINNTVITESQVQSTVERLRYETRALLAYRFGGKKPDTINLPNVTSDSIKKVTERLTHEPGRWMLRLIALENAVEGEAVLTKLEAFPSSLVYKNGHLLYSHTFKPDTPREKIEDTVFLALRSLNQKAVNDGVLRDPLTGNVGSIDSGEFAEALDDIAESKSKIKLEIYTARDIYSEGPLLVKFKLK